MSRFIPRQLEEIGELRPFQKSIIKRYDKGGINILHCPKSIGKSTLMLYSAVYELANIIPSVTRITDMRKIFRQLSGNKSYIINTHYYIKDKQLKKYFTNIEKLGHLLGEDYTLWIFTCHITDLPDEWRLYTVTDDYKLKRKK